MQIWSGVCVSRLRRRVAVKVLKSGAGFTQAGQDELALLRCVGDLLLFSSFCEISIEYHFFYFEGYNSFLCLLPLLTVTVLMLFSLSSGQWSHESSSLQPKDCSAAWWIQAGRDQRGPYPFYRLSFLWHPFSLTHHWGMKNYHMWRCVLVCMSKRVTQMYQSYRQTVNSIVWV